MIHILIKFNITFRKGNGGVDLIVRYMNCKVVIQCKNYKRKVGKFPNYRNYFNKKLIIFLRPGSSSKDEKSA